MLTELISSLGKFLKHNKSNTSKDQKSGIYKLNCGSCDKVYIGQTGRSFSRRIYDHQYSYNVNDRVSHYAKHVFDENHNFNDDFEILHVADKGKKLDLLETLEINRLKYKNVLLNDKLDLNNSPLLNLNV